MTSGEFLQRYTNRHVGPESGLPVVTLKAVDAQRQICPFVVPKGCRVYPDRPASCRTYPLARAISCNRETGKVTEHFMLLEEPHCLGFKASKSQTARQWIDDQEISIYNHFNDQLLQIIRLKKQLRPGPLDQNSRQLFYVALYDLDRFRTQIFENKILDQIEADPQKPADAETDDTALLEIAMQWVKRSLFNT